MNKKLDKLELDKLDCSEFEEDVTEIRDLFRDLKRDKSLMKKYKKYKKEEKMIKINYNIESIYKDNFDLLFREVDNMKFKREKKVKNSKTSDEYLFVNDNTCFSPFNFSC